MATPDHHGLPAAKRPSRMRVDPGVGTLDTYLAHRTLNLNSTLKVVGEEGSRT